MIESFILNISNIKNMEFYKTIKFLQEFEVELNKLQDQITKEDFDSIQKFALEEFEKQKIEYELSILSES